MCQLRTGFRSSVGAANRVAHHARPAHEDVLAALREVVLRILCGRTLAGEPALKLIHWLCHDDKRHVRMLVAAEFSALSAILALAIGLEPRLGGDARNQIALAAQIRSPEAVDH